MKASADKSGGQPDTELRRRGTWEGGSNYRLLLPEGWLGGAGERWAHSMDGYHLSRTQPRKDKKERRVGV